MEVLKKGRNTVGKGEIPSRAISSLPTVFSKHLYGRRVKTRACLGMS